MPEENLNKDNSNYFIFIMLSLVVVAIAVSFYSFYFKKNYDFYIETHCDPALEVCFYRDCEGSPDTCPPNNISYYSQYIIKARDFKACENEDCTQACKTESIKCTQIVCSEEDLVSGVCVSPETLIDSETLN